MIYWKDVATLIHKKRKFMNKTVRDVSTDLSISMDKYYRIENGVQEPSFIELQNILNYYEIEFIINLP